MGTNSFNLWALDKSGVYGNFCLVLIDRSKEPKVEEGRKLVRSMTTRKPAMDPLIRSVTKPQADEDEAPDAGVKPPPRRRRRRRR
jgi:hypothetical protein